jgi:hypothetical protein
MTDLLEALGAGAVATLLLATPALADVHEVWEANGDDALSVVAAGAG